MGKSLIIVESPAKAKTINKILGGDFVVKASMGHVRDLPVKEFGVDIKKGFKPEYVITKGREKVIHELEKLAAAADIIYLAPDPDREGEAIAWHLLAVLQEKIPVERFKRVSYNEITPRAVREAFAHPTEIDQKRVDAQQARRVLDRIVGYKVSPLLWRRVRGGVSAGRVQSVALRLVCEREDLIRNFVPEAYWIVGATVRKRVAPLDPFRTKLVRIDDKRPEIKSPERAEEVLRDLDEREMRVVKLSRREISKKAFPPFITSSMQQAASNVFGFSPDRTMRIAQGLYEGIDLGEGPVGLITYMRTDSFTVAQDALESCRRFIVAKYGEAYLPEKPNFYKSRSSAQEAHEAIRPTDITLTPEHLEGKLPADQHKLYSLIWKRFVASQMVPARFEIQTADIDVVPKPESRSTYLFRATASQLVFAGHMQAGGIAATPPKEKAKEGGEDEEDAEVDRLPPLQEGEMLDRLEWLSERKETQPPGRYSEASLIRALEENGVGRPSTYASIISTLERRVYVQIEKRSLIPTDLGMNVNQLLVTSLSALFDIGFTAEMEKELDEIEEGKIQWDKMLGTFYEKFQGWMKEAKGPSVDPNKVRQLLAVLKDVREWAPEVMRGKRKMGDRPFVESIQKRLDKTPDAISDRQLEALARTAARYKSQVPAIEQVLHEIGLAEIAVSKPEAPSAGTIRKLELLRNVTCEEPVERRGRKYDDRAFIDSLQRQVTTGRSLSPAQTGALDRLFLKHKAQIPDFDAVKAELGIVEAETREDAESGPLIELLSRVKTWAPAGRRGRRIMDDKAFYDSLRRQFEQKGALSLKQVAALKKLAQRYADQVGPAAGPAAGTPQEKPPEAGA